ncbi:hypothetical protein HHL11_31760 [Ramlibacter sp. G-1-2-2]|uniref:Outer membrane beta-barrel protein n=1 Tax=Ramlibacter agri TaxID=2728837 RepID=A0A848HBG0_9BURK|nr:hypothetical protein [Ramlibacter agri]NML48366.1 hypothetical protein [Ramlibacter agri]
MNLAARTAMVHGLAIGTMALASATGAQAQELTPAQGLLNERFVFNAGLFLVGTDISASLNGQSSTNPAIDFNDTVGRSNDATRGRIDAMWRFAPRHVARLAYFNYNSTRSRVIDHDITFGDTTFNAGGNFSVNTKLSVVELDYGYSFLKQPNYEVAADLGMHFTDMKLNLSGTGSVTGPGGTTATTGAVSKDSSLPMPLPVIGVRGGWAVAPQIFLDARVQIFKLRANGYDGHWSDAHVGTTWMFTRNWGAGLGYDWFQTRVDVGRSDFNGNVKLGYSGLQAFVTGAF